MADKYELDKAFIERLGDDVLVTRYKNGTTIDEKDALEIDQTALFMSHGRDIFTLVDMAGIKSKITTKASEYFTRKGKMIPHTRAVGLVIDGLTAKLTSRVHQQIYKPLYPTRIFANREDAMKWFDQLRSEKTE